MNDFADDDFSFLDWGVGVYPAVRPVEQHRAQLIRRDEAKKAGLKLWAEVQKELTRAR